MKTQLAGGTFWASFFGGLIFWNSIALQSLSPSREKECFYISNREISTENVPEVDDHRLFSQTSVTCLIVTDAVHWIWFVNSKQKKHDYYRYGND